MKGPWPPFYSPVRKPCSLDGYRSTERSRAVQGGQGECFRLAAGEGVHSKQPSTTQVGSVAERRAGPKIRELLHHATLGVHESCIAAQMNGNNDGDGSLKRATPNGVGQRCERGR